jgi:predicted SAM-dependent methyltransferase
VVNAVVEEQNVAPLKLDLGCGKNKQAGFIGVDSIAFEGVDIVHDVRQPWPWQDNTVEEVHSSHFVEHLTNVERIHFWNELGRVMKKGAQARIITPHWSNACAYGDPTHQWPPMSEWAVYYLNKVWRDGNAPHVPITCDFDFVVGGSWDPWLETRNQETKMFAMSRYINSYRDLIITLTKR